MCWEPCGSSTPHRNLSAGAVVAARSLYPGLEGKSFRITIERMEEWSVQTWNSFELNSTIGHGSVLYLSTFLVGKHEVPLGHQYPSSEGAREARHSATSLGAGDHSDAQSEPGWWFFSSSYTCGVWKQISLDAIMIPISELVIDNDFSQWLMSSNLFVLQHHWKALLKIIDRMKFWKPVQERWCHSEICIHILMWMPCAQIWNLTASDSM